VTPDTVVRWHRQAWRLFWHWKSRACGGRPHLSPEVRNLIATISRENRLWGTERIRGELLKLGIGVSNRSIRRYRWRGPARSPSQTWRTFLRNQAHHLWAAVAHSLLIVIYHILKTGKPYIALGVDYFANWMPHELNATMFAALSNSGTPSHCLPSPPSTPPRDQFQGNRASRGRVGCILPGACHHGRGVAPTGSAARIAVASSFLLLAQPA